MNWEAKLYEAEFLATPTGDLFSSQGAPPTVLTNHRSHLTITIITLTQGNLFKLIILDFFLFFWASLRDPIACSLLVGGILSQNSGYKITRLCPYFSLVFGYYVVVPLPYFLPVVCIGGLLVRPTPFWSTLPARSLRFLLSARVLVRFHVGILFQF